MTISVMIPTFQGVDKIVNTLEALEGQTWQDFELIVIVDGSTDGTAELIRTRKSSLSSVQIVEQANRGRAGARNEGVKKAQGDLLIFYDDDVLPAPDSVEKHMSFHHQHPGTILVGNAPQRVKDEKKDFQQYRAQLSRTWMVNYPDKPVRLTHDDLFMTAANCSMEKKTFLAMTGFNELLRDAEDKEFGIRAFQQGIPVFFDKRNEAWHDESITCRSYIRRLRQYALANHEVSRLHPESERTIAGNRSTAKKIIYKVLASPQCVDAIDSNILVSVIPKRIRYKLYDAITFALSEVHADVPL